MVSELKKQLREKYKALRSEINFKNKASWDQEITKKLAKLLPKSEEIALYHPKKTEINLLNLKQSRPDLKISLPRVFENSLKFHETSNFENLEFDEKLKIYEPSINTPTSHPKFIICPMLAFDRKKERLGFGAGFYDRAMEYYKSKYKTKLIGVAYSFQEELEVPIHDHDQTLDLIITEKEII